MLELTYKGVIEEPEGQRNFRGFDYRSYLETQGIHYQIKIEAIQSALPIQTWNVFDWLSQWRRQAIVWSKEHFPQPMNQYMTGLLFGYLDTDFEEMDQLYTSLGIIHLFALSGMQVGFFHQWDPESSLTSRESCKRQSISGWFQFLWCMLA